MKKTFLFVDVDTQHDFMDPDGALAVPGAEEIIPVLERLTCLALDGGIPILATMDTHTSDDPEFSQFPPHCVKSSPGWEKIGVTSTEKAECFQKTTYDIFSNPSFASRVKEINPRTAVVYGVATDYCVKAAVLGLLTIVPRVFVVEDAIRPVDQEGGQKAIEEMIAAGAKMITSKKVQAMLHEDGC